MEDTMRQVDSMSVPLFINSIGLYKYKKLSYCWETVRRESMPRIAAMDVDWIEQGLTSPPTQYRLSGRQFYRSKDPTNSTKVLKEKLAMTT